MVSHSRTDAGPGGRPPGPFEYRFTPSLGGIRLTRHVLANWLALQPGVDVDAIDDLLLVCSELSTNAIAHASGAEGSVALRVRTEGDDLVLEMEDDGEGFAWPVAHVLADVLDDDEHGRGLFIVEALTDTLEVFARDGVTVVRCTKVGVLGPAGAGADPALSRRFRADRERVAGNR